MLDFLTSLRLKQLFGGMGQPSTDPTYNDSFVSNTPTPSMVPSDNGDGYDVGERMKQLYTPDTSAEDKFNAMLGQYPTYKEPSKLRKIGAIALASLADLGGSKVPGSSVFDEFTGKTGFNDSVAAWKNQIAPMEQSANIERQANSNERTNAYQTVSQELKDRSDTAKNKIAEDKNKISQQRADIYAFKQNNPSMKIVIPKGGNITAINPVTGEVKDLGIDSGSLSETDKITLQQNNTMTQIGAKGQNAQTLEGMRENNQTQQNETRGWKVGTIPDPNDASKTIGVQYNEITGEIKPISFQGKQVSGVTPQSKSSTGTKGELPTQSRVRQFNAAREIANSDPELAPFIKLGAPGSNDFEITAPKEATKFMGMTMGKAGPTKEQYQKIHDKIYGSGTQMAPVTSHDVQPDTSTTPKNPKRDKAIQILQTNGKPVTEKNIAFIMNQIGG